MTDAINRYRSFRFPRNNDFEANDAAIDIDTILGLITISTVQKPS